MRARPAMASVALLAAGCTTAAPPEATSAAEPVRPVCGWEVAGSGVVHVVPGGGATVPVGSRVATIEVSADTAFADLVRAIEPARSSLVRLKVVLDGRWLLPMTVPRPPVDPPPPSRQVHSQVAGRRITRTTGVPAIRFAHVRVDGPEVKLFVEHDAPAGTTLPVGALAARLRAVAPPVEVFSLASASSTPWSQVRAALVAAACFDRKAGEEPHEVLLELTPGSP